MITNASSYAPVSPRSSVRAFVDDVPFSNTAYGFKKRLQFILQTIGSNFAALGRPITVLEIGCGTGKLISIPLAQYGFEVTGIDVHAESVALATELSAGMGNITFACRRLEELPPRQFDVVICSEVLEHIVEFEPFFQLAASKMDDDGIMIVTVPNGRGPFERQQGIKRSIQSTRLYGWMRNRLKGNRDSVATQSFLNSADTHVNFFGFEQITGLFSEHDLELRQYEGRTFLCGFCFTPLFWLPLSTKMNDWLGSVLPARWVSGWMFVAGRRAAYT